MASPDIGYKQGFKDFTGPGADVLIPAKTFAMRVHAMVMSADLDCDVIFGHKAPADPFSASVQKTCTFHLAARVPLPLQFTEDGWFEFPANEEVVVVVQGGAANVGIQVVWAKAGV
jgi:hypothetical protein